MPVFGSDQLKCSLVQDNSKPDGEIEELENQLTLDIIN